MLALTQLILIEATRDTTFDVSFNFKARPSPICQYHGMIDCLLYQRYGSEAQEDLASELNPTDSRSPLNDSQGVGFPMLPVFFPIQRTSSLTPFTSESFPITQAISAGLWCLEHMNDVDDSIKYCRVMQTDGHTWKLLEVHRSHVKKTKFFHPRDNIRQSSQRVVQHTETPRFFDDYDHMLSVIGLIRFAMGIPENIVESNELYEVEELPKALDP